MVDGRAGRSIGVLDIFLFLFPLRGLEEVGRDSSSRRLRKLGSCATKAAR